MGGKPTLVACPNCGDITVARGQRGFRHCSEQHRIKEHKITRDQVEEALQGDRDVEQEAEEELEQEAEGRTDPRQLLGSSQEASTMADDNNDDNTDSTPQNQGEEEPEDQFLCGGCRAELGATASEVPDECPDCGEALSAQAINL